MFLQVETSCTMFLNNCMYSLFWVTDLSVNCVPIVMQYCNQQHPSEKKSYQQHRYQLFKLCRFSVHHFIVLVICELCHEICESCSGMYENFRFCACITGLKTFLVPLDYVWYCNMLLLISVMLTLQTVYIFSLQSGALWSNWFRAIISKSLKIN